MPTIFTHPAVALLNPWFPPLPRRAIAIGAMASVLPDADVVAFKLGIPYASMWGHRGFSHSIVFAVLIAVAGTLVTRTPRAFPFLFLCAMSHAVLDAMTTGGLGVAFFAPFDNERYFLPWRPIRVAAIGPRFFGAGGFATLLSELRWVWLPCVGLCLAGAAIRGKRWRRRA